MIDVCFEGQAVLGPGLADWNAARDVLRGAAPYVSAPAPEPAPGLLPGTERRRASAPVRWALAVAQQALAGRDAEAVATVFVSCGGDGAITHQICEALASAPGAVSPTRFHNSVHNAPAGYWSIATRSHAASTSLSGFEGSFAIGLLEAATQVAIERCRVLLVAYDLPYPEPLHALWPVVHPFAAALLLAPPGAGPCAFRLALKAGAARTAWPSAIPASFQSNPAAWALPLLAAYLRGARADLELPYSGASHLAVSVLP
jgi:Beta-ketoacyl synthase, N-terminal domain